MGSRAWGLSVINSPAYIYGTPTTAGTYTFTESVGDSAYNSGSQSYTMTVSLGLSPASLPGGVVGTAYSQQISGTGGSGSYAYSVTGSVPPGLSLSSAGLLSGIPTTAGTYGFTVSVSDTAGHSGSASYSVTIGAPATCSAVSFSVANVSASEGYAMTFTVTASGSATITCSVSYATSDGTAIAGTNYTATSGTLSFSPGQTSQTVQVNTIRDYVYTKNLNMHLNLSAPTSGGTVTTPSATGTIINVDPNPCKTC